MLVGNGSEVCGHGCQSSGISLFERGCYYEWHGERLKEVDV